MDNVQLYHCTMYIVYHDKASNFLLSLESIYQSIAAKSTWFLYIVVGGTIVFNQHFFVFRLYIAAVHAEQASSLIN